jgi:hypothetical protein
MVMFFEYERYKRIFKGGIKQENESKSPKWKTKMKIGTIC